MPETETEEYSERLAREGRKWADAVEATRELHAWLNHPLIQAHYTSRGPIEGQSWRQWVYCSA
jgi:hypothetical protein